MTRRAVLTRVLVVALWAVAASVAVAALVAELVRPVAPDLGGLPPAGRWFDAAFTGRASDYAGQRYAAGLVSLAITLGVAAFAALHPTGRRLAATAVARFGERKPGLAAAVLLLALLVAIDIATLPLDIWTGFVREGRYGFRTQGLGGWMRDWVVARAPAWLGALLLAPLALRVVRRLPRSWPPLLGLAGGVLTAALTLAGPLLLEPLWLRTTPLPDAAVREQVERVLEGSGLDTERILVGDASRRTTKANAYVSGLGRTRRVVLFDTLLDSATPGEVGAVLAHEVAHHRHRDLPRGVLFATAGSVLLAAGLRLGLAAAARRGLAPREPGPATVPLALLLALALTTASLPVQALVSRRAEAAADWAALELTRDPATYTGMQLALARSHLADPAPPWWAYALWYSHPPVTARLELARRWREQR